MLTRNTCTSHTNRAPRRNQKSQNADPSNSSATRADEPFANVGQQHITPDCNKGQVATCCLVKRNVTLIRSSSWPCSVQCRNSSWHWPSTIRRSPWPSQHELAALSGQDLPFHLTETMTFASPHFPNSGSLSLCQPTCEVLHQVKSSGSQQLAHLPQHTNAPFTEQQRPAPLPSTWPDSKAPPLQKMSKGTGTPKAPPTTDGTCPSLPSPLSPTTAPRSNQTFDFAVLLRLVHPTWLLGIFSRFR